MGAAYYLEFETTVEGFEASTEVSGKAMSRNMEALDAIAAELKVAPFSSFYSESLQEAFSKIGESVPEGMEPVPVIWSDAKDGLTTVNKLIEYLEGNRESIAKSESVIGDLESFAKVLQKAIDHAKRFRLRMDI